MPEIMGLLQAVRAKKAVASAVKVMPTANMCQREVHYGKNANSAICRWARTRAEDYIDQWLKEAVDSCGPEDLPDPMGCLAVTLLMEARDSDLDHLQSYLTRELHNTWKKAYGTTMNMSWVFVATESFDSKPTSYQIAFSRIAPLSI